MSQKLIQTKLPNILVVDDLEPNLQLIKGVLKPLDANVITVQSGREALEALNKYEFAVVLIDVEMPEMSGVELVKIIQQDTRHHLIPLLFITAHPENKKNIENYYAAGVVDFITKPFIHTVLRGKVAVFLELHRQKQQIEKQKIALESLVKKLNVRSKRLLWNRWSKNSMTATRRYRSGFPTKTSFQEYQKWQFRKNTHAIFLTIPLLPSGKPLTQVVHISLNMSPKLKPSAILSNGVPMA